MTKEGGRSVTCETPRILLGLFEQAFRALLLQPLHKLNRESYSILLTLSIFVKSIKHFIEHEKLGIVATLLAY